jgi:hypothetical protein
MRADSSKRLTVFSEAEKRALYGLPDFDDFQRAEFFAMTETERAVVDRRGGLTERLHCLLQIGYFKAKQAFFNVSEQDVPAEDITFLLKRYFPDRPDGTEALRPLRRNEQYAQRDEIAEQFGYRLWAETDRPVFVQMAASLARRDVTPTFVLIEMLAALNAKKIVRPGYTTLQTIISDALKAERQRLAQLVETSLDAATRIALRNLLAHEDTLSKLAALKQDARHFGYQMMAAERQKRAILAPLYLVAKSLLPRLDISQQNLDYYAGLADYYTIYDLRRINPSQSHLYLLCYAWQRYRQLNDILSIPLAIT